MINALRPGGQNSVLEGREANVLCDCISIMSNLQMSNLIVSLDCKFDEKAEKDLVTRPGPAAGAEEGVTAGP